MNKINKHFSAAQWFPFFMLHIAMGGTHFWISILMPTDMGEWCSRIQGWTIHAYGATLLTQAFEKPNMISLSLEFITMRCFVSSSKIGKCSLKYLTASLCPYPQI